SCQKQTNRGATKQIVIRSLRQRGRIASVMSVSCQKTHAPLYRGLCFRYALSQRSNQTDLDLVMFVRLVDFASVQLFATCRPFLDETLDTERLSEVLGRLVSTHSPGSDAERLRSRLCLRVRREPQRAGGTGRVEPKLLPPPRFIALTMEFA